MFSERKCPNLFGKKIECDKTLPTHNNEELGCVALISALTSGLGNRRGNECPVDTLDRMREDSNQSRKNADFVPLVASMWDGRK